MPEASLPPVIEWANNATEQELRQWVHTRLSGRDRRWVEADDQYQLPSHLIATVVRHPGTSAATYAALVQAVCFFVREAVPAWTLQQDSVPADTVAGDWTAPAMVDLIFLASEILESGPSRAVMRELLASASPQLPRYVGNLPLRAKALVALLDFGGQPEKNYWLARISPDYPEAKPIAFIGMARRDLKDAIAWLGHLSVDEQGDIIRKFRPTLVKMAGGETPFIILARQHLFRSNYPLARKLRDELAPAGDLALYLKASELQFAYANGWSVLPVAPLMNPYYVAARFDDPDEFREAANMLAGMLAEAEFGQEETGVFPEGLRKKIAAKYVRSRAPGLSRRTIPNLA